jgi:hypothetical protein
MVMLAFLGTSCLEYTFTTKVNADGSCERVLLVKGDSSELDNGTIKLPNDTNWQWVFVKGIKDSINDSYTGTAKFKKVSDLNRYFLLPEDSLPGVSIKVECKRKFRWFYTYIVYTETYQKLLQLNRVPISGYLTREEADLVMSEESDLIYFPEQDLLRLKKDSTETNVLSHEDSLKMNKKLKLLEGKLNTWLLTSIFEEIYAVFLEKASLSTDHENLVASLQDEKDTIKAWWVANKFELDNFLKDKNLRYWSDSLLNLTGKYVPLVTENRQLLNDTARINRIEEKVMEAWGLTDDSYNNNVLMPGLIMKTNATSLSGNMVSWKPEAENFFLYDYVMEVESRIINRWVFWLTGILILGFAAILLVGSWRKAGTH